MEEWIDILEMDNEEPKETIASAPNPINKGDGDGSQMMESASQAPNHKKYHIDDHEEYKEDEQDLLDLQSSNTSEVERSQKGDALDRVQDTSGTTSASASQSRTFPLRPDKLTQ